MPTREVAGERVARSVHGRDYKVHKPVLKQCAPMKPEAYDRFARHHAQQSARTTAKFEHPEVALEAEAALVGSKKPAKKTAALDQTRAAPPEADEETAAAGSEPDFRACTV